MKFNRTEIDGLYIAELSPIYDDRGSFARAFCEDELKSVGVLKHIKQINHSYAKKSGSIRGMHYQNHPFTEMKLVRCLSGKIFDVVVDIRRDSKTFLKWHGEILSQDNNKMMIIPEGFAHGFQVIKPNSQLLYFHTENYHPECEGGILYNDPMVNIDWPLQCSDVSMKDSNHNLLDSLFKGI